MTRISPRAPSAHPERVEPESLNIALAAEREQGDIALHAATVLRLKMDLVGTDLDVRHLIAEHKSLPERLQRAWSRSGNLVVDRRQQSSVARLDQHHLDAKCGEH